MASSNGSAVLPSQKTEGPNKAVGDVDAPQPTPKAIKRTWNYIGLEPPLLIAMFKGALPPIICLAAAESSAWSSTFSTQSYLVAIVAFLSMAMMTRAKFLRNLAWNILFVCIGAAIALLQIQVTVSARQNTTRLGEPQPAAVGSSGSLEALAYNASASTVSALGLFITVYLANT